jgi:hypothetical protein
MLMAEMSMNKAIHGAFRRDLQRFLSALESFPAGSTSRSRQLASAWANFDDQLEYHHTGEHEIAWPALTSIGVSPSLLEQMDAEHDTMAEALVEARKAMAALKTSASAADAASAHSAMKRLQEVTVAHLDHEEGELEALYLANREAPEIQEMGRKFSKVSPARGGRFFAWILDGATPDEKAAVTGSIPGPVLKILTGIFGRGYRRHVAPVWRG